MMGRSKPSLHEVSTLVVHGQESPKNLKKTIFGLIYARKQITPKIAAESYMVSHQIGRTIELEIKIPLIFIFQPRSLTNLVIARSRMFMEKVHSYCLPKSKGSSFTNYLNRHSIPILH